MSNPLPLNNNGFDQTQDQTNSAFNYDANDHEYFASSVEEILIGRDPVTSLAAEPPHVFDIVWNMDLNAVLYDAAIRVPYQEDDDEQEHKAGTSVDAYWYELGTDSALIEIECVKVTQDNGEIALTYTNPNNTIDQRSAFGLTHEDAMANLAKQLKVVVNGSVNTVKLLFSSDEDVGSTISPVMVAKNSTGIGKSFGGSDQNVDIGNFEVFLKADTGMKNWYTADDYNDRSVPVQVKSGLAQLFDRQPGLNNLLGSAASASTFLDSDKIATKMQTSSDDFYLKMFSKKQLKEVLEAVADKGSRVNMNDVYTDRRYAFKAGDSITAVVKVKDSDAGGTNSDRWLITLQQISYSD